MSDHKYVIANKPAGALADIKDNEGLGRTTIADALPSDMGRVWVVSPIAKRCEGAVLLTDDVELTEILYRSSHLLTERWLLVVNEQLPLDSCALRMFKLGVSRDCHKAFNISHRITPQGFTEVEMSCELNKGVEFVRLLDSRGFGVTHARRTGVATIDMGGIPEGKCRELDIHEADTIYRNIAYPLWTGTD